MLARRLTGFLIAFLTLHLTFVGASVRCAQGSELSVAGHQASSEHHAGMVMEGRTNAATQNQSHPIPAQPECCRAMAACSAAVALRAEAHANGELFRHDAIVASLMSAPRSPVTPPEPPPPKA